MAVVGLGLGSPKHRTLSDSPHKLHLSMQLQPSKANQVGTVLLYGVPIVSLVIEGQERLCLAQISNTLLKGFSYNEIHNRRVALGITCVQCTPVQLEILRRAGAMPVSSRRCGMITRREAERLCKSFLGDNSPPRLPDDFAFSVHHECAWGCRGAFLPSRYNSSRAKCIKCTVCGLFFSPNKFIFHSHRTGPAAKYVQPDAANFNSWRRHMRLSGSPPMEVVHAWEDVKFEALLYPLLTEAMFNGGTRKRLLASVSSAPRRSPPLKSPEMAPSPPSFAPPPPARVPPLPIVMDYVWHKHSFPPYPLPWLPGPLLMPPASAAGDKLPLYPSAFRPVRPQEDRDDEEVDIETCPEDDVKPCWSPPRPQSQKPDSPASDQEVDVGSEAVEAVSSATPLWTMAARLGRDWTATAESTTTLYRSQVARQLSLMRELVGPRHFGAPDGTGIPFLPLQHMPPAPAPIHEAHRKLKDNVECSNKSDCSACHQLTLTSSSTSNP